MTATRLPPHSVDAEMSVLGSIMLSPGLMRDLVGTLTAGDFYQPRAQQVFATMVELYETGQPIDVVTVSQALQGQVEPSWLLEAQNATPSLSAAPKHAQIVIEASRRRHVIALAAEVQAQAYETGNDIEDVVGMLDPSTDEAILPRSASIEGLWDIREWTESQRLLGEALAESGRSPYLIPHIMKRQWRVMIVAGEGVGKATLMRQIGLHAAAGIDPWDPARRVPPIRVLYVDGENADGSISLQHRLANRSLDLIPLTDGRFHMWHRPGGIDLRKRANRAKFEAVLQRTRPDVVLIGPLYKVFYKRGQETDEQAATEFQAILDDLRTRYDFGLMIEHHPPKGESKSLRDITAFGSSAWLRWPEFGIALNDRGEAKWQPDVLVVDVERFRPDREPADWPTTITRTLRTADVPPTSNLAWAPMFEHGRGRRVGAKWVGGEWTYSEVP